MSEFVEVKTAELIGEALNWAVAKALSLNAYLAEPHYGALHRVMVRFTPYGCSFEQEKRFVPSTDWAQAGPLIADYKVMLTYHNAPDRTPLATTDATHPAFEAGETVLIAACRAIVASVLGETVSVPKELLS